MNKKIKKFINPLVNKLQLFSLLQTSLLLFRATDNAQEYAGQIVELGTVFRISATVEINK